MMTSIQAKTVVQTRAIASFQKDKEPSKRNRSKKSNRKSSRKKKR